MKIEKSLTLQQWKELTYPAEPGIQQATWDCSGLGLDLLELSTTTLTLSGSGVEAPPVGLLEAQSENIEPNNEKLVEINLLKKDTFKILVRLVLTIFIPAFPIFFLFVWAKLLRFSMPEQWFD